MVFWWGRYSYFNDELIQISDIEIMNAAYGSSGYFGSRLRSKCIGHNNYMGKMEYLHSEIAPLHRPVHKPELIFPYYRRHFSRLPKVVYKKIINSLSQKVSYDSKTIDLVISGFSLNEERIHLNIFDPSIVTFGKRDFCLGF